VLRNHRVLGSKSRSRYPLVLVVVEHGCGSAVVVDVAVVGPSFLLSQHAHPGREEREDI